MMLTVWTTFALVLWIVLWAIGSKSFDAFLLALLIIVVAATAGTLRKYLPGRQ
jgi:hypothetical protein